MGYTHYLKSKGIPAKSWNAFLEDAHLIVDQCKDMLAGGFGDEGTEPCVAPEGITLNGIEKDSHETFSVSPNATEFDFCKTAHKPYDVVVTALLSLLKFHAPDRVEVSSDGDHGEWMPGVKLASLVTGREVVCPLESRDEDDF